jgi:hypothetical protein
MMKGLIFIISFTFIFHQGFGQAQVAKDYYDKPLEKTKTPKKAATPSINHTTYEPPPPTRPAKVPANKPIIINSPQVRPAAEPAPRIQQPVYVPPATNNSDEQVQQFNSGFTDALKNNEAKSKELDEDLRAQREGKTAVEEEVKEEIHSSFSNIMAKEKAPPRVVGNCNPGSGYDTILFQDAFVIVKYKLEKIKGPIACDKYLDTKREVVPFCGYYYQATCTIINRQNNKLAIRGWINGGPTFENTKHISPVGEIGKFFFGNDTSSFYNIFLYSWDFTLTKPELTQVGSFWTEIANEKPAYAFAYTIIK